MVSVVLLVGGFVAYRVWAHVAQRRLTETMDQLRREGEPVTPADLTRPSVPAAENAVFDLRAAAVLIDSKSEAWKAYQAVPFEEPLSEEARRAVAAVLEPPASRQALARVRAARGKPRADWQISMRSPLVSQLIPDVAAQRTVADLCRAAAIEARLRGDYAGTMEYVRDALTVSRAMDSQPGLVGHFASTGVMAMATNLIEQALPEMRISAADVPAGLVPAGAAGIPARPEQIRALVLDLLDESRLNQSYYQALRDERVMELDTAVAVAEGRMSLRDLAGNGAAGNDLPLVPRPMILADATLVLDHVTAVLKAAQRSPDFQTFSASAPPSPFRPGAAPGPSGHVLAAMLLPAFERAAQNHYRLLAERRMTAVALGLRWYQAEHSGVMPRSLDELVPKYLPAVPADPFAAGGAQPLRYLRDADTPAVYSVGENGIDDRGSEAPYNARAQTVNRWDKRDILFPIKRHGAPEPLNSPPASEGAPDGTSPAPSDRSAGSP